jgi:hypothetical protein
MPTAAQPLRELPEPRKNGPQTYGSSRKNKMASVVSSRNGCTIYKTSFSSMDVLLYGLSI